jgi:rhodanese-related sulfurtransferase
MQQRIPSVTVREAYERMKAEEPPLLLDIREGWEYQPRRAVGAELLPMSELAARLGEIPDNRDVLIICEHGNRSQRVTAWLMRQGYTRVYDVLGGTDEWEKAGLPMEGNTKAG